MVTGNSEGVGGGVSKAKICKGTYEAKLEFLKGWGVQTNKPSLEGCGYFLEPTYRVSITCVTVNCIHVRSNQSRRLFENLRNYKKLQETLGQSSWLLEFK